MYTFLHGNRISLLVTFHGCGAVYFVYVVTRKLWLTYRQYQVVGHLNYFVVSLWKTGKRMGKFWRHQYLHSGPAFYSWQRFFIGIFLLQVLLQVMQLSHHWGPLTSHSLGISKSISTSIGGLHFVQPLVVWLHFYFLLKPVPSSGKPSLLYPTAPLPQPIPHKAHRKAFFSLPLPQQLQKCCQTRITTIPGCTQAALEHLLFRFLKWESTSIMFRGHKHPLGAGQPIDFILNKSQDILQGNYSHPHIADQETENMWINNQRFKRWHQDRFSFHIMLCEIFMILLGIMSF